MLQHVMMTTHLRNLLAAVVCLFAGVSAQAQFTATYEARVASGYDTTPMEFKLTEVATTLGTDTTTLVAALNSWTAEGSEDANMFFLADPTDPTVLSDNYTQGGKGGFWVNADGVPQAWSEDNSGLRWYNTIGWDANEGLFVIYIGQFPDQNEVGKDFKPHFVLKFGDKQATFDITMTFVAKPEYDIPEPKTVIEKDLNVVGEASTSVEQFPRGGYDSDVVTLTVSDIVAKLGLDSEAMLSDVFGDLLYATWYNDGDVEQGGGMKKDSLTHGFTAGAPGFWLRAVENAQGEKDGECASANHGDGCAFFAEAFAYDAENQTISCRVGQFPGALKANEKYFVNLYLLYGEKAYRLRYDLVVKEKEQGSGMAGYNKVGEASVTVEQAPTNDYSTTAIHPDMEAIAAELGCEVSAIGMYALDDTDNFGGTTANNGGFWFSSAGTVTSWGATAAFFVEPSVTNDFTTLNVGQYPDALNIDDVVSANIYFMNGENYFTYTVTLKIVEAEKPEWEFTNVATRSFTVQSLVRGGNDYTCDQYWNIAPEVIESLIGTSTPTLFGLATDEAKEAQGGNPYSNKYSCDPKPGFWLNADGRVSIWNDSNARVGISYLSDGTFQFFQFPNRNSVGDVFKTQLFLVNEESNEMITFNINLAFVNEIAQKEEVGSENLVIPVTTDEYAITLDLKTAADSLGVTVDDLLDPNNYYLRGLTAEGVYGEGQNAENGLSFNYDGGYDKYGSMYFTLGQSGDEVQLIMCSNDEVEEDYQADGQFCFEVADKQYIYYVKFVSEEVYTGIDDVTAKTVKNGMIYDLSGRRVVKPVRGIYVQDGKKFVVK